MDDLEGNKKILADSEEVLLSGSSGVTTYDNLPFLVLLLLLLLLAS